MGILDDFRSMWRKWISLLLNPFIWIPVTFSQNWLMCLCLSIDLFCILSSLPQSSQRALLWVMSSTAVSLELSPGSLELSPVLWALSSDSILSHSSVTPVPDHRRPHPLPQQRYSKYFLFHLSSGWERPLVTGHHDWLLSGIWMREAGCLRG